MLIGSETGQRWSTRRTKRIRHQSAPVHRIAALVGNPNCGKTTLFNALTGLRQKVGNYPGVTVEKKEGRLLKTREIDWTMIDLPGTYSLIASSPDEHITTGILMGRVDHTSIPDLVVCVVDACNVERSLYLVSQIMDRCLPVVVALNMIDVAETLGITVHAKALSRSLGVPVISTIASKREGISDLRAAISDHDLSIPNRCHWSLPESVERVYSDLIAQLAVSPSLPTNHLEDHTVRLLSAPDGFVETQEWLSPEIRNRILQAHQRLDFLGINRQSVFIESRYKWIRSVCRDSVTLRQREGDTTTDKLDRIVTHRIWGLLIFLTIMALMFQSVFSWAELPMRLITEGFHHLGLMICSVVPPGDLQDLIVNGALGGVAAVVAFLPQILLLFFFIGILEDSGYMARAAFVMDRIMARVGLHGKSFIPLLSSFACAVPGIMATRTIEHRKDRLVTILVAPLMSCSARLPVYTLLAAAFIPSGKVFGVISYAAVTLLSLYALGMVMALFVAWALKNTILKSTQPMFLMELPHFKVPSVRSVLFHVGERAISFLRKAGTVILGASIILWFLATYPRHTGTPAQRLEYSFAGQAGRLLEPAIAPLGFDWKIGIGLVSSMLQREMFVSTMGTIYNIDHSDDPGNTRSLVDHLRTDVNPETGRPSFTLLTALCVMVYYVLSMQCVSTLAVVRRETGGIRWPAFLFAYMTILAYVVTFMVYRGGIWLGMVG